MQTLIAFNLILLLFDNLVHNSQADKNKKKKIKN